MDEQPLIINQTEACKRYGYTGSWFSKKRWAEQGPPFIEINHRFFYSVKETDEWFKRYCGARYTIKRGTKKTALKDEPGAELRKPLKKYTEKQIHAFSKWATRI